MVSGKLDSVDGLPGKSCLGKMAVGELGADYGFIAELGTQTGQRAIGGVEVSHRPFSKQAKLLAGGSAGFGA